MEELNKKKNTLAAEQAKDESDIDTSSLSGIGDEDDLTAALSGNPIKLGLTRIFIKVKNHLATIPLLMTFVTLCVMYCTMHDCVAAMTSKLPLNQYNAFWYFVNLVLQIVLCLCYINVSGKHVGKTKQWIFFGLFLAVAALSLYLDFDLINDCNVEQSMFNSANQISDPDGLVAKCLAATKAHCVCLIITMVLVVLVPVLQPLTKKIHIGRKKAAK